MENTKQERLAALRQERQNTMVSLVYASQEAYAQLEQARKELYSISRIQFLKKRRAKQNVAAKNARMAELERQIQAAHEKYQASLKELEN